MKKLNLIGLRFEKLTVLSELLQRSNSGKVVFECQCDCGKIVHVVGSKLKNGWTKSCSCLQKEITSKRSKIDNKTHGFSRTSIYTTYHTMIARCYNPNTEAYKNYGGRGIKVCDRWLNSFENFAQDMGEKPDVKFSIERIDFNGNYEPSNCKWADNFEQENNKSTNVHITYQGNDYTIAELSRMLNINYYTLRNRTVKKNIFTYE
jgi:hypothetical protein